MIEVRATAKTRPLGMPPARFLREYWQKQPLLIRGAFPQIPRSANAGRSRRPGLRGSRRWRASSLHDARRDRGRCATGRSPKPISPSCRNRDWTLLVQDVDKWDADVAALLQRSSRSCRAGASTTSWSATRPTAAAVGAHVDNYDVFLLQGLGPAALAISTDPRAPKAFRDDAELKLLRTFAADARMGARTRRHAVPAARRAASRRRDRRMHDVFGRHARAIACGVARRFRGYVRGGVAGGIAVRRCGSLAVWRRRRDRRCGDCACLRGDAMAARQFARRRRVDASHVVCVVHHALPQRALCHAPRAEDHRRRANACVRVERGRRAQSMVARRVAPRGPRCAPFRCRSRAALLDRASRA